MNPVSASTRACAVAALAACLACLSPASAAALEPSALFAIDQNRAALVDTILRTWHPALEQAFGARAAMREGEIREALFALRADRLWAASLADGPAGLATAFAEAVADEPHAVAKALGDPGSDVTYVPVTPCRLVDTRGTYNAVYKGGGAFTPNQVRTYTAHGGNGVCLTQLPSSLNPAAIQMQVFGLPTTSASGDLEILPQGAAFGSTATMVYIATLPINTVSAAARVNLANDQISVQVRGGGAHVAIDVVGYFAAPSGTGGQFLRQGGNAFGVGAKIGTLDNQPFDVHVNGQRAMHAEPTAYTPNILNGYSGNGVYPNLIGVTIAGGGGVGAQNDSLPIPGLFCTLGYGCINGVLDSFGTVGGGAGNLAGSGLPALASYLATVGGGLSNWAYGGGSTVAGGLSNTAVGASSSIGGGLENQANADYAVVPGGFRNRAKGVKSLAAGSNATAGSDGEFTWADSSSMIEFDPGTVVNHWSDAKNTFNVRATGGVWFVTAAPSGAPTAWCALPPSSGAWSCTSSRDAKTDFARVDPDDVLRKVVALPVETWRFKGEDPDIRHMGPMAQDFHAAFHLGHDPKAITTTDAAGVALAAIQALHARIEALERELHGMRESLH